MALDDRETHTHMWETRLVSGLIARAPLRHEHAARRMVHRLKYHGDMTLVRVVAGEMARCLPSSTSAIVPVPRALARRIRYGVDPAGELARAVALRGSAPLIAALGASWWWPAHAGTDRLARIGTARFRARAPTRWLPRSGTIVLVDDVITTGATATEALNVLAGVNPQIASRALVVAATLGGSQVGRVEVKAAE